VAEVIERGHSKWRSRENRSRLGRGVIGNAQYWPPNWTIERFNLDSKEAMLNLARRTELLIFDGLKKS